MYSKIVNKTKTVGLVVLSAVFMLWSNTTITAQSDLPEDIEIGLLAKPYGDSIVVRLFPDSWHLWHEVMKNGFTVTRYETATGLSNFIRPETATNLTSDGNYFGVLYNSSVPTLSAENIKGLSLDEKNARLINYREGLTEQEAISSENMGLGILSVMMEGVVEAGQTVEEYRENQDFMYVLAQMYANRDANAGQAMGLRFTDHTTEVGKSYYYEFASVDFPDQLIYDISLINNPKPLAPLKDAFVIEADGQISLAISKVVNDYDAYWIERSAGDGNYELLTEFPYTEIKALDQGGNNQSIIEVLSEDRTSVREIQVKDFIFYKDSIANYEETSYRIQGQNSFAEKSAPLILSATAIDLTPPVSAYITTAELIEKQAYLAWDFDAEATEEIIGFKVLNSDNLDGFYEEVPGVGLLGVEERDILVPGELNRERFYYYAIEVIDENGNSSISPARFLNVPDEEPPAMPVGAEVTFDTTGIMSLTWTENEERDLSGYRVFFSYEVEDDEYMMMSQHLETEAIYMDTIDLTATLYDTLYYKISAEDISGNLSEKMFVAVPIPDMVPPVPPILANPIINKDSIVVSWINSSSEDVAMHRLLRRIDGDTIWATLAEITNLETEFYVDLEADVEILYQYTMIAIDDSEWESDYAYPFHARRFFDDELVSVTNFNAQFDKDNNQIELKWDFERPEIKLLEGIPHYFHLYKSVGDAPPVLYQRLSGEDLQFSDDDIQPKATFNYAVKVVFENGKRSNLTPAPAVTTE